VLERKNELGLILDTIASCLDLDPKNRPTIQGLLNSPLFKLDKYELTNAVRFSQNVILYRSPSTTVSMRITEPLRVVCGFAMQSNELLLSVEEQILTLFSYTEECIRHINSMPLDLINEVLTEDEKRKAILQTGNPDLFKQKDYSKMRVSPNSPLAAQVIEDKIIDMLIFLTLRFFKAFNERKTQIANEDPSGILRQDSMSKVSSRKKSVKFKDAETSLTGKYTEKESVNMSAVERKREMRKQNQVLARMVALLKMLVYEMHSYSTPMAPFVDKVIEYIVRFYVGEEYELGSDFVLRKTSGMDDSLKDYLRGRSFFRRESELTGDFTPDQTDKQWFTEQKNKNFLNRSTYWSRELHKYALLVYKDAITESGMGQSCYPVINEYISRVSEDFQPKQAISNRRHGISQSFLIPVTRTISYYNEMIPLSECLVRLYDPELERAGKRCALAVVRSVFQTGNSDKIKACLDLRIPQHIIHFLQDSDSEVRNECLLIFYEISKGLQDEDSEILGKVATNQRVDLSQKNY